MIELLRKFGFTKNDLLIICFLIITLIFGLILEYAGWNDKKQFDYKESDSKFEQQINSLYSELESISLNPAQQNRLNSLKSYSDSLTEQKEINSLNSKISKVEKKININLAYSSDLQLLPGIGEVTAERIIEYREQNNGFKNITEIMNVKGIGQKKFEKIKEYITTE
jgi:comEA protein